MVCNVISYFGCEFKQLIAKMQEFLEIKDKMVKLLKKWWS